MPGGELRDHITNNRDANPIQLVSLSHHVPHSISSSFQLLDVAEGLAYLHSCDVIHGDLKGVRVFTATTRTL